MLERLTNLPAGIDGFNAVGRVSKGDYEQWVVPLLEDARREGRHLRLLYQLGPDFQGFTPGAAWEDARIGLRYLRLFGACAVVSDIGWIRESTQLAGFLLPCPVKAFSNDESGEAVEWLRSLSRPAAVSHRLLADAGVIVVEVDQALRAEDFDAIAVTADPWIEAHGDLRGLVIHARRFPGWENLGGFLRHVRFVRDHHRKVKRIALATDGLLAGLAQPVAEHFVQAEIKSFHYDEVDGAVAWASGGAGTSEP